jgi:1-acyl-sn-glycerol-3-phosphate acyltransferase
MLLDELEEYFFAESGTEEVLLMFHIIARFICFLIFKIFFRIKAFGRENFPLKGPVIVASNHVSFLDPVAVGVSAPRKLNYMARDTLFKFKPFAFILRKVDTFPVKRGESDIGAFKACLKKLSVGKAVLIFPEGTRSNDGSLQKPRFGVGFLQTMSEALIVPCYVKGAAEVLPRHARFPRFKPVSVYFGDPLKFDKEFSEDKKKRYNRISEEVMEAIKMLKEKVSSF